MNIKLFNTCKNIKKNIFYILTYKNVIRNKYHITFYIFNNIDHVGIYIVLKFLYSIIFSAIQV